MCGSKSKIHLFISDKVIEDMKNAEIEKEHLLKEKTDNDILAQLFADK